ncbi:hypothetical protein MKX01_017956, partial [Papaver californicum]
RSLDPLLQIDCNNNCEVFLVVCFKDKNFSGDSDKTLKANSSFSQYLDYCLLQ